MKFKKLLNGRALYIEKDRIWIARGMSFLAVNFSGNPVTPTYRVGSLKHRMLSCTPHSRLLLREGLHHLLPMSDGNIFVTGKKQAYIVNKQGETVSSFSGYAGNKPAHQGVCVTPDNTLFFGEYAVNLDHSKAIHLYRSRDGGKHFEPILGFDKTIRHIHFVKYDPYERAIWLGTGDADSECRLMKSLDNGDSWETVGEGSQDWRAIGVCFSEDALIWGTDAGSVPDRNHIIRMERTSGKIVVIADAEGPCHGCGGFSDGRIFISTGVEGGENEQDRWARLKRVDGLRVEDVFQMRKNIYPLIMQYGVMRFPCGTENSDRVVFTALGLRKGLESVYIETRA